MRIGWKIRELFTIFLQISSNNFFPKRGFLFHKGNFFSQTARCSLTPMSLGSSASFRRIVPFRDTSTMESKIPSFRDAKPKQSWLLKRIASPLQGFAMTPTAYTFCSRFQVHTGQNFLRRLIFTYTRAKTFRGNQFSRTHAPKLSAADNFHVHTRQNFLRQQIFTYTRGKISVATNFHVKTR